MTSDRDVDNEGMVVVLVSAMMVLVWRIVTVLVTSLLR